MFDKNGDGRIIWKELSDLLEKLGIHIAEKNLSQMTNKINVNGDDYIDVDEFGALYVELLGDKERGDDNEESEMCETFIVFAHNGDRFITVDDLRTAPASLGFKQGRSLEECKRMIHKVDGDGDGMVNFNKFRQMMKGGGFTALT